MKSKKKYYAVEITIGNDWQAYTEYPFPSVQGGFTKNIEDAEHFTDGEILEMVNYWKEYANNNGWVNVCISAKVIN